jgi:hypothetical protein
VQEVVGQSRDIIYSLSKKRQLNRQGIDAIEKILAKMARFHLSFEGAICGAYKANINSSVARGSDPAELTVLKQLEKLGLKGGFEFTNLIQEECAAVSKLNATRLRAIRAGKGTLLITEELTLQKGARNGGAADLYEGPNSPRRLGMEQLRKHFLSSTALPAEQDRNVGAGGNFQFLTDFAHDRRISKNHLIRG